MKPRESLHDVVFQHAEEVSSRWARRRIIVGLPNVRLPDLLSTDELLDAHVDGLRVAGRSGWRIVWDAAAERNAGAVFAAMLLAIEREDEVSFSRLLALADDGHLIAEAIVDALCWNGPTCPAWVFDRLSRRTALHKALVLEAKARLRLEPETAVVDGVIAGDDPVLRSAALRAAGLWLRRDLLGWVHRRVNDDDPSCRYWAAWTLALMRHPEGSSALREIAWSGNHLDDAAADAYCRLESPERALSWVESTAGSGARMRLALTAAAALGLPSLAPWMLEQMSTPPFARLAGYAFATMAGIDLSVADLETDQPEGFVSGPSDDPADNHVAMDPDENLPWPDVDGLRAWWKLHGSRFAPAQRYLLGHPVSSESLRHALLQGTQPQRRGAAFELFVRGQSPGMLFDVNARAQGQVDALRGDPRFVR